MLFLLSLPLVRAGAVPLWLTHAHGPPSPPPRAHVCVATVGEGHCHRSFSGVCPRSETRWVCTYVATATLAKATRCGTPIPSVRQCTCHGLQEEVHHPGAAGFAHDRKVLCRARPTHAHTRTRTHVHIRWAAPVRRVGARRAARAARVNVGQAAPPRHRATRRQGEAGQSTCWWRAPASAAPRRSPTRASRRPPAAAHLPAQPAR